jgi:hypothetical protein
MNRLPVADTATVVAEDGASLLDDARALLSRFVAFPDEHALNAVTLWCVHTHAMDAFGSTPRLALLSPEPGSGKTRALEIIELLVLRPLLTVNVTPAYLFRKVADPSGLRRCCTTRSTPSSGRGPRTTKISAGCSTPATGGGLPRVAA